jgi:corrinoid protein of di/trimethylamine methyltransferase
VEELMNKISESLQRGKAKDVKVMVQEAIDNKISAQTILNEGLLSGMNVIGVKFKANEIYVPDVLVAARAMKAGTDLLKPLLVAEGVEAIGTVVIGTVKGDLHDIGKNLVSMMMEGKGLKIVDLGTDVPAEKFVEAAIEHKAQVIACSALLTTTMGEMKAVIQAAEAANIRGTVKVMVGGAPVTEHFARDIGADLYAPDAASAADKVAALVTA